MQYTTDPGAEKAPDDFVLPTAIQLTIFGQHIISRQLQPSIKEIAEHTCNLLGVQALPLIWKFPKAHQKWRTDKLRQEPGLQEASDTAWESATGYGILAVPGSDLYFLDLDSNEILNELLQEFPDLLTTTPMTFSGDFQLALKGHCHLFLRLTLAKELTHKLIITRKDSNGKRREAASLRHLDYVVGPGSLHPSSQQPYSSNNISVPRKLDPQETAKLLAILKHMRQETRPPKAIPLSTRGTPSTLVEEIVHKLEQRGYRRSPGSDWLNGRCLYPENHAHQDNSPSFGVNVITGVGHCFEPGCGTHNPQDVAAALRVKPNRISPPKQENIPIENNHSIDRPYAFSGELGNRDQGIRVELNIAASLFRQRRYQAARFYDLLCRDSSEHDGQHTYTTHQLEEIGQRYSITRHQVQKARSQLVQHSLLVRVRHGVYRRVGVRQVQQILGLDKEYGVAYVPEADYIGSIAKYTGAVLLTIEHFLPSGLASETIAAAAGISRRSVYRHENELGVKRTPITQRVTLATATGPSFVKVFDSKWGFVQCLSGGETDTSREMVVYDALQLNGRVNGRLLAWDQLPSHRELPDLYNRTERESS